MPLARYVATLTATDSHSVNKLTSKWIASEQKPLGKNRFHFAAWCTQHKTGNAVEQVSDYLDIIKPGFCIASCLSVADIAEDLDEDVRHVLEDDLDVLDPASAPLDAGQQREQDFLKELFEQCHVLASGPVGDSEEERKRLAASSEQRRRDATEILTFLLRLVAGASATRALLVAVVQLTRGQRPTGQPQWRRPLAW